MNQNILKSLINILKRYSANTADINEYTPISSIKIDSLDFLEFQMCVDEKFNIEIPIEKFLECESLGDVVDLIQEYSK